VKRFIAITTIVASLLWGASQVLVSPSAQSAIYEQIIEARLSRHADGTLEPATVVINREGLAPQVQNQLSDLYAKTGLQLSFLDSSEMNNLSNIIRRSSQPVHVFSFSKEHYRNGWAGMDVLYNGPSGKKEAFMVQVVYAANKWQVVREVH
jgi:hypothetical protein